ncbi:MAG: Dyp-type peroxidase, partial [Burkholderiales bacterium]|nr:Dyp-type peroxidase [Burkholderiales bacterium]
SAYAYREKFDLSDFEDGIENPQGEEILPVAIVAEGKLAGSSFWVLQQWLHDFDWLSSNDSVCKEACIGRSMDDSRQLDNLPDSAHIKKAAKENFTPEADLLRKSMPWSDDDLNGGLMFSCFSVSFRSFNLQMASMLGINDGITDGVFNFSKILNTSYLWCPPIVNGRIDLSLFNAK